ncbi:MAG: hypothetical protein IT330_04470, partial [Anaerolineae bacterium]|nr:hypothetical protein [Anaerolineae bacterium]
LLRGYYKVAILQKLPLAEKDCREAEQIVPKALAWAGQTQRLSGSEIFSREHAAIWDSWVRAFQNCWEKATKPCVNRNIPEQWHRVLTLGRQAALLELDPELYDPWAVPQCPCSRITAVQAWRGTITYSYSKSASGGGQKVELHQEANVTSQLARTSPTYPSFIGSVSGAAQIDRSWYLHGNLVSTTAGGPIVPYDPAANMGSRMNLVLYQNTCTYWFGVSVHVNASTCGSSGCSSVTALAGVVNSAYDRVHPISDYNLTLSGSGYMAAHADPYPHPREDVYFPMDSTLEWIASEGNLGNAWVTWSFTPMDVPPGP